MKDRATNQISAKVVEDTTKDTLQGFVHERIEPDATVYTDSASPYASLKNHESVRHSVGKYVRGKAHTNGVESFWSMLKRAYKGTFHKMRPKHLQRYVNEFACRHNIREMNTTTQMAFVARRLMGKHLPYAKLIAD